MSFYFSYLSKVTYKKHDIKIIEIPSYIDIMKLKFLLRDHILECEDDSKCFIVNYSDISLIENIFEDMRIEGAVIFLNDPYSIIKIQYCIESNNGEITIIGLNENRFKKLCNIIGHNGYMYEPYTLNISIQNPIDFDCFKNKNSDINEVNRNNHIIKVFYFNFNNTKDFNDYVDILVYFSRGKYNKKYISNIIKE